MSNPERITVYDIERPVFSSTVTTDRTVAEMYERNQTAVLHALATQAMHDGETDIVVVRCGEKAGQFAWEQAVGGIASELGYAKDNMIAALPFAVIGLITTAIIIWLVHGLVVNVPIWNSWDHYLAPGILITIFGLMSIASVGGILGGFVERFRLKRMTYRDLNEIARTGQSVWLIGHKAIYHTFPEYHDLKKSVQVYKMNLEDVGTVCIEHGDWPTKSAWLALSRRDGCRVLNFRDPVADGLDTNGLLDVIGVRAAERRKSQKVAA